MKVRGRSPAVVVPAKAADIGSGALLTLVPAGDNLQPLWEEVMALDEGLAHRVREVLDEQPGLTERKMFGGIGYMIRGNMACGVHGDGLIVRVGPDRYDEALAVPYTRDFDMTGRPMKGWVVVDPGGYESDDALRDWVQQGVEFALSLPAK